MVGSEVRLDVLARRRILLPFTCHQLPDGLRLGLGNAELVHRHLKPLVHLRRPHEARLLLGRLPRLGLSLPVTLLTRPATRRHGHPRAGRSLHTTSLGSSRPSVVTPRPGSVAGIGFARAAAGIRRRWEALVLLWHCCPAGHAGRTPPRLLNEPEERRLTWTRREACRAFVRLIPEPNRGIFAHFMRTSRLILLNIIWKAPG
eukprot:scaffold17701_cov113-Isochrysis_galbana.AAC.6